MEKYFPRRGEIIDLGCGNGLFTNLLKLGSKERKITGYDLDEKKIQIARKTQEISNSGINFYHADILKIDYPESDVFCLSDVLYLIPYKQQYLILKKCYSSLRKNGLLVIKEIDTKPKWKYLWNFFQETFAVKILNFTLGRNFYFRGENEFKKILSEIGFKVKVIRLDKGYWYPHILYLCYKNNLDTER
ncbi:class I SAM-dependent methyltransferase [Candidatus Aminicenantes bacterium AC-334-E05]|nr:class I SAM-dependent methyltransferase [Candidatus Aminicenantes bacterium AC-334-E05]